MSTCLLRYGARESNYTLRKLCVNDLKNKQVYGTLEHTLYYNVFEEDPYHFPNKPFNLNAEYNQYKKYLLPIKCI